MTTVRNLCVLLFWWFAMVSRTDSITLGRSEVGLVVGPFVSEQQCHTVVKSMAPFRPDAYFTNCWNDGR